MRRLFVCALVLAGCQRSDPLYCGRHMGMCNDAGNLIDAGGIYALGGSASGIGTSSGLVLQNNSGDDTPVPRDGTFVFPTLLAMGAAYNVTVSVPPTNPAEDCTVANGAGNATSDVNDVSVTCKKAAYSVGGAVFGLNSGTTVTLGNGGDVLPVGSNMAFTFPTKVQSGAMYNVTVTAQPATGGPCTPFGNAGTVGNSDVTTVVVNCGTTAFTVGGTVAGLNGSVVLKDSSNGDMVTISANGTYSFPMLVVSGGPYNVSVMTQPTYPPTSQTCMVGNASGTANGNIQNVNVTCTTNKFTVGGMVSGLSGTVVLQDNGGDNHSVSANGGFTFSTSVASGQTYAVGVLTQPSMQTCTLTSATGTVKNANVNNVAVNCQNNDLGILCGTMYCAAMTEECCDPEGSPSCIPSSGSCGHTVLSCDSTADCANGQLCCISTSGSSGHLNGASCKSTCSSNDYLCDRNAATPCPSSRSCITDGNFGGYYHCN